MGDRPSKGPWTILFYNDRDCQPNTKYPHLVIVDCKDLVFYRLWIKIEFRHFSEISWANIHILVFSESRTNRVPDNSSTGSETFKQFYKNFYKFWTSGKTSSPWGAAQWGKLQQDRINKSFSGLPVATCFIGVKNCGNHFWEGSRSNYLIWCLGILLSHCISIKYTVPLD